SMDKNAMLIHMQIVLKSFEADMDSKG
ncbi:MAG: hypothetical protein ACI84C_001743, partial [Flavobacteriales bacterium]